MLTNKQRAELRGMANTIDTILQVGKGGVTETVIVQANDALRARELIKIKLQEGALLDPKVTANEAAAALGAEFVQAIGRKFVLYRESKENKQIMLPR